MVRKTSEIESELSKTYKYKNLYVHYDGEMLQKIIQPALLKILIDFDKICTENNIYYVITAGTLLGAIREKGFIAWDDDIDILVLPEGWKQLKKAIRNSDMQGEYEFLFPEDSPEITVDGKFVSKKVSLGSLLADEGLGHNIYMDVLRIENVPDNKFFRKLKSICSRLIMISYNSLRCFKKNDELLNILARENRELKNNLRIRKIIAVPAAVIGKKKMLSLMNKVNAHKNVNSKYISIPCGAKMYEGETFLRDVFLPAKKVEFEGYYFNAPFKYDVYLSQRYGDDYMTPPAKSERGIKCFKRRDDWKSKFKQNVAKL